MACTNREISGSCAHHQCQFKDESGHECVDLWAGKCEIGLNCVGECPLSFSEEEKEEVVKKQLAEIDAFYLITT